MALDGDFAVLNFSDGTAHTVPSNIERIDAD